MRRLDDAGLFEAEVDDSYVLMRQRTLFEHVCFTVHDEAGLRSLPVGTLLRDTDAESEFYWELTERGWVFRGVLEDDNSHSLSVRYRWGMAQLGASAYAPFAVLNPEILGLDDFAPEHDEVVFADHSHLVGRRARLLHVDQRTGLSPVFGVWHDFEAEILGTSAGMYYLRPLWARPDKAGRANFYWSPERLEVLPEESAAA